MTWDVPTAQDCPSCGQTMFKKSGRGQMKPFCINEKCPDFLPEDKRGYKRRMPKATTDTVENAEEIAPAAEEAEKKPAKTAKTTKTGSGQGRQGRENCEDHEKSGGEKACRTQKDKNGERSMTEVRVIGAGLAGSEAAWQLAERGFAVRPVRDEAGKNDPCAPLRRFCGAVSAPTPCAATGWKMPSACSRRSCGGCGSLILQLRGCHARRGGRLPCGRPLRLFRVWSRRSMREPPEYHGHLRARSPRSRRGRSSSPQAP